MRLTSLLSQQQLERLIEVEFAKHYMKTADGVVCRHCLSLVTPVKGWLTMHDARAGDGVCIPIYKGEGKLRRPIIRQIKIPFCLKCEKFEHLDICCHI